MSIWSSGNSSMEMSVIKLKKKDIDQVCQWPKYTNQSSLLLGRRSAISESSQHLITLSMFGFIFIFSVHPTFHHPMFKCSLLWMRSSSPRSKQNLQTRFLSRSNISLVGWMILMSAWLLNTVCLEISQIIFRRREKLAVVGMELFTRGLHDGKEIAVKKLHPLIGLNDEPFDKEFNTLSKIHHENVVQLIGYCYESRRNYIKHNNETITAIERERILCFEYMKGGSLEKHIADEMCVLDWPICYKIIRGTSAGLNHLHNAQDRPIFHLDLKPSNILLDENLSAKLADLGLSRIVATTKTHRTERVNMQGTLGYMPPEYIDSADISKKFDVFSLGYIIIRILDGNAFNSRYSSMDAHQFIKQVTENWERRLQGTSRYQSHEKDTTQVKKCIEIALRCVEKDRNKRPSIKDIVNELEELEAEIQKMSLRSDHSNDPIGQIRSGTSIVAVDPKELRFLFEPRKDISTCLQLTNLTDKFTAFKIKTNQAKYYTQPNEGIMPPCSECYICVTLREQDKASPNMQFNDVFLVQSANVSEGLKPNEITDDLFKEGKVVDMVKLPIVYVAVDQFQRPNI